MWVSKCYLESMIIYVFVNIIGMKGIKGVIEGKVFWYVIPSIHTYQMSTANNCVQVDHCHERWAIKILWLYLPHVCALIWLITKAGVPVYECTWIDLISVCERKEKANTSNIKATHAFGWGICVDKYTVEPTRAFPPRWYSTNPFTAHTTSPTEVTWCIKYS